MATDEVAYTGDVPGPSHDNHTHQPPPWYQGCFVRSSGNATSEAVIPSTLTGDEAKKFYESVVNSENTINQGTLSSATNDTVPNHCEIQRNARVITNIDIHGADTEKATLSSSKYCDVSLENRRRRRKNKKGDLDKQRTSTSTSNYTSSKRKRIQEHKGSSATTTMTATGQLRYLETIKSHVATLFRLCEKRDGGNESFRQNVTKKKKEEDLRELRDHLVRIASLCRRNDSSSSVHTKRVVHTTSGACNNETTCFFAKRTGMSENDEYVKILNSSDQYGWTAVMCAAACNNVDAVKLLVAEGAQYSGTAVTDKGGHTLRDICWRNNAMDVADYLRSLEFERDLRLKMEAKDVKSPPYHCSRHLGDKQKHRKFKKVSSPSSHLSRQSDRRKAESVTGNAHSINPGITIFEVEDEDEEEECDTCGVVFRKSLQKKHDTSVAHLIRDKSKSLPDKPYTIPEHNVGFQMMLRTGWEQESGLGPDGSGCKRPIRTALKLDKSGLGLHKTKERVSHFKARDTKAVATRTHEDIVRKEAESAGRNDKNNRTSSSSSFSKKKQRENLKHRSIFWERDLRRYMSTND